MASGFLVISVAITQSFVFLVEGGGACCVYFQPDSVSLIQEAPH